MAHEDGLGLGDVREIEVKGEFIHYEWNLPLTYSFFLLHPETIKEE
jgi:hypothetical protein